MPAELHISERLANVWPAVRPTIQAARRLVRAVAPQAAEIAYRSRPARSNRSMWKLVHYRLGDASVVGIGTFPDHASLFFLRGRELDDGGGLLQGRGKQMRSIGLRAPADVKRSAVRRMVRRAFALAGAAGGRAGR